MHSKINVCQRALTSLEEIKEILLNQDFFIQDEYQINDIYMIEKDTQISLENLEKQFPDYIIIREFVGKKSTLIFKQKELNEKGEIIGYTNTNCPIVSCTDAYNLMQNLGYKKLLNLNTHNILFSNGKNEVIVEDVEELGLYITMNQNNFKINHNNGDTLEDMINTLKKYDLPLDNSNYVVNKSYDMLKKNIKD